MPTSQPAPIAAAPTAFPTQTQTLQPEPAPGVQPEVEPSQSPLLSDTEEIDTEDDSAEKVPSDIPSDISLEQDIPEHGMVVRLGDDFPDLAGAQSGCYGLENCRQINGNFRQIAQQLVSQMKSQGYELTEREDLDNTGHRVFEVIHPDDPSITHYLNVFSPDIGSAVYVLAVDILSLEELKQLNG